MFGPNIVTLLQTLYYLRRFRGTIALPKGSMSICLYCEQIGACVINPYVTKTTRIKHRLLRGMTNNYPTCILYMQ